jgi:methylmalonyl-CoA mutase cobalamin-binding domain/chain
LSKEDLLKKVFEYITSFKIKEIPGLSKQLLEADVNVEDVGRTLSTTMENIGIRYDAREIGLPHLFLATRSLTTLLQPYKEKMAGIKKGTVVLGTIKGDVHGIGKNLVGTILELWGYEIHNLGEDVDYDKFIEKAKEVNAQVIGLSSLLTLTKTRFPEVIKRLEVQGLRDKIKVMVGGAPVTSAFAKEVDADGYAHDAVTAVEVINALMKGERKYID